MQAESRARSTADESRSEVAKLALLESRLNEVQSARVRIQTAAADTDRVFMSLPTPTWLCDMETRKVQLANDAAAAMFGIEAEKLRGRTIADLLPGFEPGDDLMRAVGRDRIVRPDGSSAVLEIRRRLRLVQRTGELADRRARRHGGAQCIARSIRSAPFAPWRSTTSRRRAASWTARVACSTATRLS